MGITVRGVEPCGPLERDRAEPDTEPDADTLGLRLEVISKPGEDFAYDLSFDVVTTAVSHFSISEMPRASCKSSFMMQTLPARCVMSTA